MQGGEAHSSEPTATLINDSLLVLRALVALVLGDVFWDPQPTLKCTHQSLVLTLSTLILRGSPFLG